MVNKIHILKLLLAVFVFSAFGTYAQRTNIIMINGKYGLVRPDYPKIVVEPQYDYLSFDSRSKNYFATKNQLKGIIDSTGKIVIPFLYSSIDYIFESVDNNGAVIYGSNYLVTLSSNGLKGIISNNGAEILACKLDNWFEHFDKKTNVYFFTATIEQKMHMYDSKGKLIYSGFSFLEKYGDLISVDQSYTDTVKRETIIKKKLIDLTGKKCFQLHIII